MGLAAVVRRAAGRFGTRTAVVAPEGWGMSYAALDRCSDEVAAGLAARGVGPGDVIALLVPSSPDYLVAYLGAAKAGAATAGVNPRLAVPQRRALLERVGPALVAGTRDLLAGWDGPAVTIAPATGSDDMLTELRASAPAPAVPEDPARPVAIVFTSGTTGTPRGAVFTDAHVDAITRLDVGDRWGDTDGRLPMLASTELVHVGAMTKLGWYLRLGATQHLLRPWRPGPALQVISGERIATVGAIAAQVALMLREADFDRYDLDAVRTVVAGGGPSPPALVREARERFGAAYSIRYSSTESGGVGTAADIGAATAAPGADDDDALLGVGRPRPGVELVVRDGDGRALPTGQVGTVWLRSAAVMAGYWRDPAGSADVLADGWLRTGDLGRVDRAGRLRLCGRAGDMFVRGGYNVHPEPVEAVLAEHPLVRDVAVVPRPDPVLGEVGVALVVPSAPGRPPTLDQLRSAAADRLARHELPDELLVVSALPRTPLHKLDRRAAAGLLTPRQASR